MRAQLAKTRIEIINAQEVVDALFDSFMDTDHDVVSSASSSSHASWLADDVMTMAPEHEKGFYAGSAAGVAGDRDLWPANYTAGQAGIVYPTYARARVLVE